MTNSREDYEEGARAGKYSHAYMVDAAYTQLVGLCRGVLVDKQLHDAEIVALDEWLTTYASLLSEWPGKILARRVRSTLRDGLVEDEERAELAAYLERVAAMEGTDRFDAPTTLPLTNPEPHIEYEGRTFCLTGTFLYGPRRAVTTAIREWGGDVVPSVGRANYLVIGATITPAWKYGTHGRKIEEAVYLIEQGHPLAIVSEAHWSTSLC